MRVPCIRFINNNFQECIDFCTLKDRKDNVLGCCAKVEENQLYVNLSKHRFEPDDLPNWQLVKDGQKIIWELSHFAVEDCEEIERPEILDPWSYE